MKERFQALKKNSQSMGILESLLKNNWIVKVFVRNPNRAKHLTLMGKLGQVSIYQCDIMDAAKVEKSIASGSKVINLVGILEEKNIEQLKAQLLKEIHRGDRFVT